MSTLRTGIGAELLAEIRQSMTAPLRLFGHGHGSAQDRCRYRAGRSELSQSSSAGLGIVTLVLLILAVGLFTTNVIGRQVVKWWEGLLNRVPVVRGIYSTIKSMMDVLSVGERGRYNRVVLIQFPKNGQYCFAFVTGTTQGEAQSVTPEPLLNVYVPTSPNPTSGYFLLVPEKDVTPVDISVEEAMKLIVSGGLYSPEQSGGRTNGDGAWSKVRQPEIGVPIG